MDTFEAPPHPALAAVPAPLPIPLQVPPPPPPPPPPPAVLDQNAGTAKRKLPPIAAGQNNASGEEEYQQLKRPRKIEPRGVPWFVMLERLKQYRDRYGSLNVPSTFRQDPKLASWVQYQRYLYHHKDIAEERKAALDAIGFEWSVLKPKSGGKKATWDEQLARVAAYAAENNGNTCIPYSYQPDPSLGFWVSKQRKDYKHGQISEEKIAKLNAIGFAWKPPTGRRKGSKKRVEDDVVGGGNRQSTWEKMFQKLQEFQAVHGSEQGHSRSDLNAIDKQLATWIKTQRHMYTIRKMSAERQQKLEAIGFAWRVGQDWKDYFARLKDYKEKFGTCDLPAGEDPRLVAWVDSQRVSYKYRELPKAKFGKLRSIGFDFAIDDGLEALESSAPPVDVVGSPAGIVPVVGGGKPQELTAILDQAASVATQQPTSQSGVNNTKLSEYKIAIQLAGLAAPKQEEIDAQVLNEKNQLATQTEVKQPEQSGTELVVVDAKEQQTKQVDVLDNQIEGRDVGVAGIQQAVVGVDFPAKSTATTAKETHGANASNEAHLSMASQEEDLDELEIQMEIVELQTEKVRLQEEKVLAQKEKLALLGDIKSLEDRNKVLAKQVQGQEPTYKERIEAESNKEKNELQNTVRLNEELLNQQATQVKKQRERLAGLLRDLSEMG